MYSTITTIKFNNNFIMYDSQTHSEVYKGSYSSEIGKAMLKDNQ